MATILHEKCTDKHAKTGWPVARSFWDGREHTYAAQKHGIIFLCQKLIKIFQTVACFPFKNSPQTTARKNILKKMVTAKLSWKWFAFYTWKWWHISLNIYTVQLLVRFRTVCYIIITLYNINFVDPMSAKLLNKVSFSFYSHCLHLLSL